MQCRGRQGGVVRPSLPGSSTPPRRYKYSVGLIPDKPLSPVSIPQDPRDLTSRHARSPSHRGACPTPALLPPGSSSRASPPLPRIDGVRVLRRAGALRRRFPPLRLPGVRASSLPFPPVACSLLAASFRARFSVDPERLPRSPRENVDSELPSARGSRGR
jgi:hypothetical protein